MGFGSPRSPGQGDAGKKKKKAPENSGGAPRKVDSGNWALGGTGKVGIPPALLKCRCGRLAHGLPKSVVRILLESGEFKEHAKAGTCEPPPPQPEPLSTAEVVPVIPHRRDSMQHAAPPPGMPRPFVPVFSTLSTDSPTQDDPHKAATVTSLVEYPRTPPDVRAETHRAMSAGTPTQPAFNTSERNFNMSLDRRVVMRRVLSPQQRDTSPSPVSSRRTVVRSLTQRAASAEGVVYASEAEVPVFTRRRGDLSATTTAMKPPPSSMHTRLSATARGRDFLLRSFVSLNGIHRDAGGVM